MGWKHRVYKEHTYFKNKRVLVAELNNNQIQRIKKFDRILGFNDALHLIVNLGLSKLRVTHGSQKLDTSCTKAALMEVIKKLEKGVVP